MDGEYKNSDYEFLDAFEYYLRSSILKSYKNKESENKFKKYKKARCIMKRSSAKWM